MFGSDILIDKNLKNEKVLKFEYISDVVNSFPENAQILEIGCGGGTFIRTLASDNPNKRFVGMDTDSESMDFALNQKKMDNLRFNVECDISQFDFIFMVDVLEHIDNPYDYLSALHEKMKTNAMLLIHTPLEKNGIYFFNKTRKIKSLYSEHVVYFEREDFEKRIKTKFNIIDTNYHYHWLSGLRDFLKYYIFYSNHIEYNSSVLYSKNWKIMCGLNEKASFLNLLDIFSYYESKIFRKIKIGSAGETIVIKKK